MSDRVKFGFDIVGARGVAGGTETKTEVVVVISVRWDVVLDWRQKTRQKEESFAAAMEIEDTRSIQAKPGWDPGGLVGAASGSSSASLEHSHDASLAGKVLKYYLLQT